jgi:putative transposase
VFNDSVVKLIRPGILTDRLTEVLRDGARVLLTQAVEAEVSEFLAATADLKTDGCGASCDTGICRSARS